MSIFLAAECDRCGERLLSAESAQGGRHAPATELLNQMVDRRWIRDGHRDYCSERCRDLTKTKQADSLTG